MSSFTLFVVWSEEENQSFIWRSLDLTWTIIFLPFCRFNSTAFALSGQSQGENELHNGNNRGTFLTRRRAFLGHRNKTLPAPRGKSKLDNVSTDPPDQPINTLETHSISECTYGMSWICTLSIFYRYFKSYLELRFSHLLEEPYCWGLQHTAWIRNNRYRHQKL